MKKGFNEAPLGEIAEVENLGIMDRNAFMDSNLKKRAEVEMTEKELEKHDNEIGAAYHKLRTKRLGQKIIVTPPRDENGQENLFITLNFEIGPSFEIIRLSQDGSPKSAFTKELHDILNSQVKKELANFLVQKVSYYTTLNSLDFKHGGLRVKSTLDAFYGVDAFFDFVVNGQRFTVTLDGSLIDKLYLGQKIKADLNIVFDKCLEDPDSNKAAMRAYSEEQAARIIENLKKKVISLTN